MNNLFMLETLSWLSYTRVIVGVLGLVYFLWFYFKWKNNKRYMSTLSFYSLSKSVKKGQFMWIGLLFLTISFSVDLIAEPTINTIFGVSLFQTLGIIIIGYAFYEYLRSDLKKTNINAHHTYNKHLKDTKIAEERIEKEVENVYAKLSKNIKKPKTKSKKKKRKKAKRG